MKNLKDRLTILQNVSSTYTDLSFEAFDFLRDSFTVSGTLYVGFEKPINALYFRTKTAASAASVVEWSYWNGSWELIESLYDDTRGLSRDGFVQWERPEDEVVTTVENRELFWYRFEAPTSEDPIELWGVGPLFCDEHDLKAEYAYVDESLMYPNAAEPTHIGALVSARDRMLKELKASAFDIFNLSDAKDAAVMLALSIIFNAVSDSPDDKWAILSKSYEDEYRSLKAGLLLEIDQDDDGKITAAEKKSPGFKRWGL